MPGILTMESGRGAFELLEFSSGRPYPKVLFAVFLFCMLPPLLLGALRGWLDRNERARQAMVWPLRATAFWLPCVLWWIGWIVVPIVFPDSDGANIAAVAVSMLILIAVPFMCLNPSTLDDPAPTSWWRPGWPGWRALLLCLVIWVVSMLASFVAGEVVAISIAGWLTALLSLLDELLSACVLVLAIAIWLNRGRWQAVRSDLLRIVCNGFVGEYFWQTLAMAVGAIGLGFPLLVAAMEAIFVIPQYEQWAEVAGTRLPFGLQLVIDVYRGNDALLLVLTLPFAFYLTLVQGRLMRQHEVGKKSLAD